MQHVACRKSSDGLAGAIDDEEDFFAQTPGGLLIDGGCLSRSERHIYFTSELEQHVEGFQFVSFAHVSIIIPLLQ